MVALDADTLFPPGYRLGELARWFADPRGRRQWPATVVGNRLAEPGHALVQALEYNGPEPGNGGRWRRPARSPSCLARSGPGANRRWRRSAVNLHDTLAEDQDLTIACQPRRLAGLVRSDARAYIEDARQRTGLADSASAGRSARCSALRKHRAALFNRKQPSVLGFVAMPQIWLFQIFLTAVSPLVDLAIVWSFQGDLLPSTITRWNGRRTTSCVRCSTASSSTCRPGAGHGAGTARAMEGPGLAAGAALRLPPADVLCRGQVDQHRDPQARSAGASSNAAARRQWTASAAASRSQRACAACYPGAGARAMRGRIGALAHRARQLKAA